MKITVISGNMRHGSTWHCMDILRQELAKYGEAEVTEFSLPKDMPHPCVGCFSCFYKGEAACPHAASVQPIVRALETADLIIMTSPVYAMDVSGALKTLLDHLCYMWFSHRPNPKMFNKLAVTITTTAGAGLSHTSKTMKNSLTFWGVKKIYAYKNAVSAMQWSDVSDKKQAQIRKEMSLLAKKIHRSVDKIDRVPAPLFRSMLFKMMSGMQKGNNWNATDRAHWEQLGWLSGAKPF